MTEAKAAPVTNISKPAKAPPALAWAKYPAQAGFYLNLLDGEPRLRLVTQADIGSQFFAKCGLWFGPLPVPLP